MFYYLIFIPGSHVSKKKSTRKACGGKQYVPVALLPFFSVLARREGNFGLVATLFIKSTHPHLMSKEPAAGEEETG
jgi:hypothetical protein